MSSRHKISDAVLNQAEIYAEMECGKLFYRPANELKAATERIIKDAFINGYITGSEQNNNDKSENHEKL